MKILNKTLISTSIVLALTACGGGGENNTSNDNTGKDTIETPARPVAAPELVVTNIDLSNADSIAITGETNSSSSNSAQLSPKATQQNVSSSIEKSGISDNFVFNENSMYKVLPDGTFAEVEVSASGDDIRGALTPKSAHDIGNGLTAVVFADVEVQAVASDVLFDGSTSVDLISTAKDTTYIVDNQTGQAYKADFLGTPFFEYDQGEIGLVERGGDGVDDTFQFINLSDEKRAEIYSSISFDDLGNMYLATVVPDYSAYADTGDVSLKDVFLQVNLADMSATEMPVVFRSELDYSSVKVAPDGTTISYYDGDYRYINTDTLVSSLITREDGESFDLVFKSNGNMFGYIGEPRSNLTYSIDINEGVLSVRELNASSSSDLSSFAPHTSEVNIVNGKMVVGGNGIYGVFSPSKGRFEQSITINNIEDTFVSESFNQRNVFNLVKKANGTTEILKWTPNKTFSEVEPLNIDPDIYEITSFNVVGNRYVAFEAVITNPLDGFNVGDVVLARINLVGSNQNVQILKTLVSSQPSIISLDALSQGDFISIDGLNNDWPIEYRIASNTELNDGLAHLSFVENSNDVWFLIESNTSFEGVSTTLTLNGSESIEFFEDNAIFTSAIDTKELIDVRGIYSIEGKNIEVTIPKEYLTNEMSAQVSTHSLINVINDVNLSGSVVDSEIALLVTIYSDIDDLTIALADNHEIIINGQGNDYVAAIDGVSIDSLGVSLNQEDNTLTINIPLSSVGLLKDDIDLKLLSVPDSVLGGELDTL